VVAIVRGNGDDVAYSRLRAGYDSGDAELLKVFDDLAAKHLKVYAGTKHPVYTVGTMTPFAVLVLPIWLCRAGYLT